MPFRRFSIQCGSHCFHYYLKYNFRDSTKAIINLKRLWTIEWLHVALRLWCSEQQDFYRNSPWGKHCQLCQNCSVVWTVSTGSCQIPSTNKLIKDTPRVCFLLTGQKSLNQTKEVFTLEQCMLGSVPLCGSSSDDVAFGERFFKSKDLKTEQITIMSSESGIRVNQIEFNRNVYIFTVSDRKEELVPLQLCKVFHSVVNICPSSRHIVLTSWAAAWDGFCSPGFCRSGRTAAVSGRRWRTPSPPAGRSWWAMRRCLGPALKRTWKYTVKLHFSPMFLPQILKLCLKTGVTLEQFI